MHMLSVPMSFISHSLSTCVTCILMCICVSMKNIIDNACFYRTYKYKMVSDFITRVLHDITHSIAHQTLSTSVQFSSLYKEKHRGGMKGIKGTNSSTLPESCSHKEDSRATLTESVNQIKNEILQDFHHRRKTTAMVSMNRGESPGAVQTPAPSFGSSIPIMASSGGSNNSSTVKTSHSVTKRNSNEDSSNYSGSDTNSIFSQDKTTLRNTLLNSSFNLSMHSSSLHFSKSFKGSASHHQHHHHHHYQKIQSIGGDLVGSKEHNITK